MVGFTRTNAEGGFPGNILNYLWIKYTSSANGITSIIDIMHHDPVEDDLKPVYMKQYYTEISRLFMELKGPDQAYALIVTLIACRQFRRQKSEHPVMTLPLDVVKLIANQIWNTRKEECWVHDNLSHLSNSIRIYRLRYAQ